MRGVEMALRALGRLRVTKLLLVLVFQGRETREEELGKWRAVYFALLLAVAPSFE
jgi:hypothetical protein